MNSNQAASSLGQSYSTMSISLERAPWAVQSMKGLRKQGKQSLVEARLQQLIFEWLLLPQTNNLIQRLENEALLYDCPLVTTSFQDPLKQLDTIVCADHCQLPLCKDQSNSSQSDMQQSSLLVSELKQTRDGPVKNKYINHLQADIDNSLECSTNGLLTSPVKLKLPVSELSCMYSPIVHPPRSPARRNHLLHRSTTHETDASVDYHMIGTSIHTIDLKKDGRDIKDNSLSKNEVDTNNLLHSTMLQTESLCHTYDLHQTTRISEAFKELNNLDLSSIEFRLDQLSEELSCDRFIPTLHQKKNVHTQKQMIGGPTPISSEKRQRLSYRTAERLNDHKKQHHLKNNLMSQSDTFSELEDTLDPKRRRSSDEPYSESIFTNDKQSDIVIQDSTVCIQSNITTESSIDQIISPSKDKSRKTDCEIVQLNELHHTLLINNQDVPIILDTDIKDIKPFTQSNGVVNHLKLIDHACVSDIGTTSLIPSDLKLQDESNHDELPQVADIPKFYFKTNKTRVNELIDNEILSGIDKIYEELPMNTNGLTLELFETKFIVELLQMSKYLSHPVFHRLDTEHTGVILKSQLVKFSKGYLSQHDKNKTFFHLIRQQHNDFIWGYDFGIFIQAILDRHPALQFLKDTIEFQKRYTNTVIARLLYVLERFGTGKIYLTDLRRFDILQPHYLNDKELLLQQTSMIISDHLPSIWKSLDNADDMNHEHFFFSYEHFYVIYCLFWDLDDNHDFQLDEQELLKYDHHALSTRTINRIFAIMPRHSINVDSSHCKEPTCHLDKRLSYEDFIVFLINDENKTTDRSLEFWFDIVDLDSDGYIRYYEMKYFYDEQCQRLESLNHETISFHDILCQMNDLFKPKIPSQFTLADIKQNRHYSGIFFDILLSLTKFMAYELRDAFQVKQDITDFPNYTPWDRFCRREYDHLTNGDLEDEEEEEDDDIVVSQDDNWDIGGHIEQHRIHTENYHHEEQHNGIIKKTEHDNNEAVLSTTNHFNDLLPMTSSMHVDCRTI